jgi:hypothetical protein
MAIINGRYYSSVGRYSAYATLQIQRYQASQANQKFLQTTTAVIDTMATANSNYVSGMSDITAKIAIQRIQAESAASAAQATSFLSTLNTVA